VNTLLLYGHLFAIGITNLLRAIGLIRRDDGLQ
jgi:hypothetical protein